MHVELCVTCGRIAYSVQRLARATRSGDRIPVGTTFAALVQTGTGGTTSLLYNGYRVFPGGKERPGLEADPSPPSSAVVMKEQSYTSTSPMGRTASTEPQCLYKGELYLSCFTQASMYNPITCRRLITLVFPYYSFISFISFFLSLFSFLSSSLFSFVVSCLKLTSFQYCAKAVLQARLLLPHRLLRHILHIRFLIQILISYVL